MVKEWDQKAFATAIARYWIFCEWMQKKAVKDLQQAVDAYGRSEAAPPARIALALYTRAMLVVRGDATGDVQDDLDRGDDLVREGFPEAPRFRGLFRFVRSSWLRLDDELDEAQRLLDGARIDLKTAGIHFDRFELEREQARLACDRRDWSRAVEAAEAALSEASAPAQAILARTQLADVHEAHSDPAACLAALDAAASAAYDAGLKEPLWELQDRIKLMKERYPDIQMGLD